MTVSGNRGFNYNMPYGPDQQAYYNQGMASSQGTSPSAGASSSAATSTPTMPPKTAQARLNPVCVVSKPSVDFYKQLLTIVQLKLSVKHQVHAAPSHVHQNIVHMLLHPDSLKHTFNPALQDKKELAKQGVIYFVNNNASPLKTINPDFKQTANLNLLLNQEWSAFFQAHRVHKEQQWEKAKQRPIRFLCMCCGHAGHMLPACHHKGPARVLWQIIPGTDQLMRLKTGTTVAVHDRSDYYVFTYKKETTIANVPEYSRSIDVPFETRTVRQCAYTTTDAQGNWYEPDELPGYVDPTQCEADKPHIKPPVDA
jgi:hypothetical protein